MRTSIAGGLAWLIAQVLPAGDASRYAYFAPMGAVIVTSTRVTTTVMGLVRSTVSLIIGAGLGLMALTVVRPNALSVAAVIAASVLVAGWRWLGSMRAWVPTMALFTMILGRDQPWTYVSAYTGLSALGAAVGVAVVALLPRLVLTPLTASLHRLWYLISDRLDQLHDHLADGEDIDLTGPTELDVVRHEVSERLGEAADSNRLNRKSRRERIDFSLARGRSVHQLAIRIADFETTLDHLDSSVGSAARHDVDQAVAAVLALVIGALRSGRTDELDESLGPSLTELDKIVGSIPAAEPGRHSTGIVVNELRRLALATREAVERNVQDR